MIAPEVIYRTLLPVITSGTVGSLIKFKIVPLANYRTNIL